MDRPEILEGDLVVIRDNDTEVYQVKKLSYDLQIEYEQEPIKKGTLVLSYYDCDDIWYSYCLTLNDLLWKVVQIYRKIDGEYKIIWRISK